MEGIYGLGLEVMHITHSPLATDGHMAIANCGEGWEMLSLAGATSHQHCTVEGEPPISNGQFPVSACPKKIAWMDTSLTYLVAPMRAQAVL